MTELQAAEIITLLETAQTLLEGVRDDLSSVNAVLAQIGILGGLWFGFFIFDKLLHVTGVAQWFARIERNI